MIFFNAIQAGVGIVIGACLGYIFMTFIGLALLKLIGG